MKIFSLNNNISFNRALTTVERKDFEKVQTEAKNAIGNNGLDILIVQDTCLPVSDSKDYGCSSLGGEKSLAFFDLMKSYLGINAVKVLPQGEMNPSKLGNKDGLFYCNYASSALSLGIQNIDLNRLTQEKYGKILSQDDVSKVVASNDRADKREFANLSNIIPDPASSHYQKTPFENALDLAYENYLKLQPSSLKEKFELYKNENEERLQPKAFFEVLRDVHMNGNPFEWSGDIESEIDKNLYNSSYDKEKRQNRIAQLKEKYSFEIDEYYFKQFLADEMQNENRQELNKKGLKLFGDCLIGFSTEEIWSHVNAFEKGMYPNFPIANIGWNLPALKYSEILDKNSEANKLLMEKIEFFAKRYDGIRFDVGWAYVSPSLRELDDSVKKNYRNKYDEVYTYDLNGALLDNIEAKVKEVKGDSYNKDDLIYETEAGGGDFSLFLYGNLRDEFKDRKFVQSTAFLAPDFATIDDLEKRGADTSKYVYMTNNHDHISLRRLSEGDEYVDGIYDEGNPNLQERLEKQRIALKNELHIDDNLSTPKKFMQAKFAQIKKAKNTKVFYMDVFGRKEEFDAQQLNNTYNYRYKIPEDFERAYHTSLQEGFGLNSMECYKKVMESKGIDKEKPELYNKVANYAKILAETGVKTEEEANLYINA